MVWTELSASNNRSSWRTPSGAHSSQLQTLRISLSNTLDIFANVAFDKLDEPTVDIPDAAMTDPGDRSRDEPTLPLASDLLALANRPVHLIAHPVWSAVREKALALTTAGPAIIVILGRQGPEKTLLHRDLARTFGECGRSACLLDFPG